MELKNEDIIIGRIISTDNELAELGEKWQGLLGLRDWTICYRLSNREEMDNNSGLCTYNHLLRQAVIELADPSSNFDNKFNQYFKYDMEKVLVHELLHPKMAFITDNIGDVSETSLEYAVAHIILEDLANALVDAERMGRESAKEEGASKDSN
jgi:hypothetical protein